MAKPASYKSVIWHFEAAPEPVRWYFDLLPKLLKSFPYEVALAYLFLRTEKAHNRALYAGAVKLHRANPSVTDGAVNTHYLSRADFLTLVENVFGQQLPKATIEKIKAAEKIRDKVIHGKKVSDPHLRVAVTDVLDYATALNVDLKAIAGFEPFGPLQGFKGRGQALDEKTTRWLLKGLGFRIA